MEYEQLVQIYTDLLATVENLQDSTLEMQERVSRMVEAAAQRDQVAARLQDGLFYIHQRAREACDDEKPIDSAWLVQITDEILYADQVS